MNAKKHVNSKIPVLLLRNDFIFLVVLEFELRALI
jgi:hypothetical protein